MERVEMAGPHWQFLSGSPLGRLELAPLNSDLGRYFGTDEGVLVISAPKDSALSLRGGDVVLAVDGRAPSSPSHLLRILRSYETGETFKLDIMRNRKRETVTARIGKRDE
jgi:S1-C subfamily serine protease